MCVVFLVNPEIGLADDDNETKKIIIKYKDEVSVTKETKFNEVEILNEKMIIEVDEENVDSIKRDLIQDSAVEYVEVEKQYTFFGAPNDPFYKTNQALDFKYIQASLAWELYKPSKRPIVAVIDSGIDRNHPDLKNRIVKPFNVINSGSYPIDDVGHGTHVAGIIGAETNNGIGISSLSKGVDIMPVKVGDKSSLSTIDIAKGIEYAVDHGADIINISIGGEYSKIIEEACNYADSKGVLVVAAAGNEETNSEIYPAALDNVIGVGAIDSYSDSIASFSNYGQWVSVAAPGVEIYSTYLNSKYKYMSGTSMASPLVASLASLLKSHDPTLSHQQVRWIIEFSSEYFGGSESIENGGIDAYESLKLYDAYGRIYGGTSVETSNKIAEKGWGKIEQINLQPSDENLNRTLEKKVGSFAIIASNQSFPDSLAASALSDKLDTPILLTFPDLLKDSTVKRLKDLGVTDVLLLGGKAAITESVEKGLNDRGYNTIRISGEDRYETAVKVNNYIATTGGTVILANGSNYPDALSISSYSGKLQYPIVFVEKNSIPRETKEFLDKYKFKSAIVVGGTSVVSEKVKGLLPNAIRIAGNDRYDTNIKINSYFNKNTQIPGFLFATGNHFADALSGGALSNKLGLPLILVDKDKLPYGTKSYLIYQINGSSDMKLATLGGTAALSSKIVWELDRIVYKSYYNQIYSNSVQYLSKNTLNISK